MSRSGRPKNARVSTGAVALLASLLASCSMGPPPEITNSLRSGYSLDKVSVVFSDDATVFVTGASIPENATKPVMQEFAREAIAKGVKNRLGEIMTGPRRASATITVKTLNCPEVPAVLIIGGFSYLQAYVTITDAESVRKSTPSKGLWHLTARALELRTLRLQSALSQVGTETVRSLSRINWRVSLLA